MKSDEPGKSTKTTLGNLNDQRGLSKPSFRMHDRLASRKLTSLIRTVLTTIDAARTEIGELKQHARNDQDLGLDLEQLARAVDWLNQVQYHARRLLYPITMNKSGDGLTETAYAAYRGDHVLSLFGTHVTHILDGSQPQSWSLRDVPNGTATLMAGLITDLHHFADAIGLDWHKVLTEAEETHEGDIEVENPGREEALMLKSMEAARKRARERQQKENRSNDMTLKEFMDRVCGAAELGDDLRGYYDEEGRPVNEPIPAMRGVLELITSAYSPTLSSDHDGMLLSLGFQMHEAIDILDACIEGIRGNLS